MKNLGIQITIALICLVLGLMLSVQFKSIKTINSNNVEKMRTDEIQKRLKDALARLDDREKKLKEYQEAAFQKDSTMEIVKKEIEEAKLMAGMVAVNGKGIIVTLNDNKMAQAEELQSEEAYLVHDRDILMVVNELRASGAEAIAVNDQRLTANSEIRCVGTTIMVNSIKIPAPYVIKAIGDPNGLESSLRMRGGVIETYLEPWIEVSIKKEEQENIEIPRYEGAFNYKYSRIKEEGGN